MSERPSGDVGVVRNLDEWLTAARADAERRGLPGLTPLLGPLQAALRELRTADWNDDFSARRGAGTVADDGSAHTHANATIADPGAAPNASAGTDPGANVEKERRS